MGLRTLLVSAALFAAAAPGSADAHHFDRAGAPVEVLFLGDTSFGENYQDRLAARGRENVLKARGYDYVIGAFAEILRDASLVIANLETPITDLEASPLEGKKAYVHYADVEKTPRNLSAYNFGLVSLANNHALDYGMAGLEQTLGLLAGRGIEACGAGATETQARRPYSHEIGVGAADVRIAVLCAFEFARAYDRDYGFYAHGDACGVNALSADIMAADIQALRGRYGDVFGVVFPHWGKNYRLTTDKQRRLGRALIDAGADLVVGHGAHLLQELEHYRGRWIVYGLGNFVFASPGRYKKFGAHPYGMIARLTLAPRGGGVAKALRLYPIFTDNLVSGYRSRFVTAAEFDQAWDLLARHSAVAQGFGAAVRRGADRYGRYLEMGLD